MEVYQAPKRYPLEVGKRYLFLAGSIEMGSAEKWQDKVIRELSDTDWVLLNPRRDNWDDSWKQEISDPQFYEQVKWELNALEWSDTILLYFDPTTKSPISLLELGLHCRHSIPKLIVVCPEGFWRKGNVEIVCEQYCISQLNSLDTAIKHLGRYKTVDG